jgi:thiaminase
MNKLFQGGVKTCFVASHNSENKKNGAISDPAFLFYIILENYFLLVAATAAATAATAAAATAATAAAATAAATGAAATAGATGAAATTGAVTTT